MPSCKYSFLSYVRNVLFFSGYFKIFLLYFWFSVVWLWCGWAWFVLVYPVWVCWASWLHKCMSFTKCRTFAAVMSSNVLCADLPLLFLGLQWHDTNVRPSDIVPQVPEAPRLLLLFNLFGFFWVFFVTSSGWIISVSLSSNSLTCLSPFCEWFLFLISNIVFNTKISIQSAKK